MKQMRARVVSLHASTHLGGHERKGADQGAFLLLEQDGGADGT